MIHLIIGYQGSGKTLLLTKIAYDYYKRGYKVYSNVAFTFPYLPIDYHDIIECNYSNAVVIIDEIHQLLPARQAMRKINVEICDSFLSMVRKQNLDVYGSTQTLRKVDIRFREEADYLYECVKYAYKGKRWEAITRNTDLPKEIPIIISVVCQETRTLNETKSSLLANPYFKLFDTKQIIRIRGLEHGRNRKT